MDRGKKYPHPAPIGEWEFMEKKLWLVGQAEGKCYSRTQQKELRTKRKGKIINNDDWSSEKIRSKNFRLTRTKSKYHEFLRELSNGVEQKIPRRLRI